MRNLQGETSLVDQILALGVGLVRNLLGRTFAAAFLRLSVSCPRALVWAKNSKIPVHTQGRGVGNLGDHWIVFWEEAVGCSLVQGCSKVRCVYASGR